jgi:hypothetical protein
MRRWSVLLSLPVILLMTSGCDKLPALPGNPFAAATPTVAAVAAPPPPPPSPTPVPSPTAVPFAAFWVKNFTITDMWSGPSGQPGVVSFGQTSSQFCSFQVVKPQEGGRLYVLNPYSKDYFWIDADAVGPVDAPQKATGPKPADQNCTDQQYD